ncbi:Hypothetical protein NTJ_16338 [Nesidiocoris tenuis]|nr:Hypothetical protein NTJ_16338 [Nesidiocoris tenuis]
MRRVGGDITERACNAVDASRVMAGNKLSSCNPPSGAEPGGGTSGLSGCAASAGASLQFRPRQLDLRPSLKSALSIGFLGLRANRANDWEKTYPQILVLEVFNFGL